MEIFFIISTALMVFLMVLMLRKIRYLNSNTQEDDKLKEETEEKINILSQRWGETLDRNTRLIMQQLNSLQGQVSQRLDSASQIVNEVQKTLGKLGEENKRIFEVGKDISSLQELLRQPKFRGEVGEYFLENILTQIIPREYFTLQYNFKSGEKVDAVVKIGGSLVAIDAKFPLESFRRVMEAKIEDEKRQAKKEFIRAVKKHIDDIANKYILPDEGTYDFAMMYIPAENVYYETIIKDEQEGEKNIREYALSRKVVPVSPNSFYAYLMVIVKGLKGLTIEKRAKEVMETLSRLANDFGKFSEEFSKMGGHLNNTRSSYDRAEKNLERLGEKLKQIETGMPPAKEIAP